MDKETFKIQFMPTILEHSAKLFGKTPSEAAVNPSVMAQCHIKAYEKYRHDSVIVGIDVYNIEAEALGCKVRYYDDCSIPGIESHPYDGKMNLDFSIENGRISGILQAAKEVNEIIGVKTKVSVAVCGPFSIAVELAGYERLLIGCFGNEDRIEGLLEKILEHQRKYCDEIIKKGAGIVIFESWATPPLISPDIYREYVMPYEKKLIELIRQRGAGYVPLVIGGQTKEILQDMIGTGTSLLVADYGVDLEEYIQAAEKENLTLRANIDPKLIEKGTPAEIINSLEKILSKVEGYGEIVIGTGVIPYDTPSENILLVKEYLDNNLQ